jgi:hypothetical protein
MTLRRRLAAVRNSFFLIATSFLMARVIHERLARRSP